MLILPRKILIQVLIALVVAGTIFFLYTQWRKERADRIRLQQNQQQLLSNAETFRIKDSSQVATYKSLVLQYREFRKATDSSSMLIRQRLTAMGIRLRSLESVARASIVNKKQIITNTIRDTTIFDTIQARTWNYSDKWYEVKALEFSGHRNVQIVYRDQITQAVYKERRSWNPFKRKFYQARTYRQVISFSNPNTQIQYPQYIKIVK